jgi:tetratricopeptide (TPR) repeat protein
MRTHHSVVFLAALLSSIAAGCGVQTARPSINDVPGPCAVALAAAHARDDADRDIARLQERAAGAAGDAALEQLGYRFVARARARGDDGDYLLAERAAACLLERRPGHAPALLLRGHVLHQMHRFAEAEQIARQLVATREFVLDYGLLGDVLMERGRLRDAAAAYQKMIDLKPFFQSYTRAAHLRWMRGDLDGALEMVRLAIAAASPRDPESLAWARTRLAFYELQAGRPRAAQDAADAALVAKPDYAPALLARARVLLHERRAADAIPALRRAAATQALPEYQWALADALRRAGEAAEAEAIERALHRTGASADPRTYALFLATRRAAVPQAIDIARRELANRADVFTLDALAWALAAAGRTAEAEPLMARALAEGTHDGRLFAHAASIAAAAGRHADAARWLQKADRLRATLLPSELDALATVRSALSPQTPRSTQSTEEN